jgi:hypothetical protein
MALTSPSLAKKVEETPRSLELFLYYLELPPAERTLGRVAAHFQLSEGTVSNISGENNWAARARAYDAAVADHSLSLIMEEQARERLRNMRERTMVKRMLRNKAYRYLDERELVAGTDPKTGKKILGMDYQKAKLALDFLVASEKSERLDDDLVTERTEVKGTGAPLEIRIVRDERGGAPPPTIEGTLISSSPPELTAAEMEQVMSAVTRGGRGADEDSDSDPFPTEDEPDPS